MFHKNNCFIATFVTLQQIFYKHTTKHIIYGNKWKEENFSYFYSPLLFPFPKTKSPNTPYVRKIKKKRGLLVIIPAVVVASGTYVDDYQGN